MKDAGRTKKYQIDLEQSRKRMNTFDVKYKSNLFNSEKEWKIFVETFKGQLCRREATEGGGTWRPQNRNLFKPLFLNHHMLPSKRIFNVEK